MIVTIGSIALDTTRTPTKSVKEVLGGSGTYFSIAASFFHPTGLVGVVGNDFPRNYREILKERVNLAGLQIQKGKTFRFESKFDIDLNKRTPIKTELNVFEGFEPLVPQEFRKADYVYLGNIDPDQQLKVLDQIDRPKLVVSDTMQYWIDRKPERVREVISKMNGVLINNDEIRLLCNTSNLIKCSRMVLEWGAKFVIVKKGEHGAILSTTESVFPSPAYPLSNVVDPTGAGDTFAAGLIGHIARKRAMDENTIREAVVYGNVMGSFVVEDFSIRRLLSLTKEDIEARYQQYIRMVHF